MGYTLYYQLFLLPQNSLASASSKFTVIAPTQVPSLWSRLLYKFLRSLSLYTLQPPLPINAIRLIYAKNADPDTFFSSFKENHQYFSLSLKGDLNILIWFQDLSQYNSQITFLAISQSHFSHSIFCQSYSTLFAISLKWHFWSTSHQNCSSILPSFWVKVKIYYLKGLRKIINVCGGRFKHCLWEILENQGVC